MTRGKRKWETKDLSRFAWEIVDTHTADQPQEPFDWLQHVENLCAPIPDEDGDELTLQQQASKRQK